MGVCWCVWVCAGVLGCARVCSGVLRCARVCAGVHGRAQVHAKVHTCTAEQYSKLQKKRARNSVPKCPCKLLQPADRPMAGSSSLKGHFGTGLLARFSSAWSNVGCDIKKTFFFL